MMIRIINKIVFIFLIITLLGGCKVPQPLKPGDVKYKEKVFQIENGDVNMGDRVMKYISVKEKNGKFSNNVPPHLKPIEMLSPIRKSDVVFDHDKLKQIVMTVLKNKLEKLESNNEHFGLRFYIDKNGDIGMVSVNTKNPTIINIKEIYEIQRLIKQDIKVSFLGESWRDYGVISWEVPTIRF